MSSATRARDDGDQLLDAGATTVLVAQHVLHVTGTEASVSCVRTLMSERGTARRPRRQKIACNDVSRAKHSQTVSLQRIVASHDVPGVRTLLATMSHGSNTHRLRVFSASSLPRCRCCTATRNENLHECRGCKAERATVLPRAV